MRSVLLALIIFAGAYCQTGSMTTSEQAAGDTPLVIGGPEVTGASPNTEVIPSTHADDRSTHPVTDAIATGNEQVSADSSATTNLAADHGSPATKTAFSSVAAVSGPGIGVSKAPSASLSATFAPPSLGVSGSASAVKLPSSASSAKPSTSAGPTPTPGAAGHVDSYANGAIGFALLGAALLAF
ncbi:hypothetical protein CspeluHIS016_0303510 [Cutaneotrichosporon spelunceum]|uniref:Uncharacterized protein n=1 Tax=Cutaneotrichosporon spelunceum TaxID=1672016 RepID=A0AAD3YAZ9_9TREE|nr:hypothetical protein CspeluHIS016_0303510 [Cutaneotrichosporon spelunceum]